MTNSTEDPFASQRLRMVSQQLRGRGVRDPAVLTAFETVPRHMFVPEHQRGQAYEDRPLPIGSGQTISQPYVVGLMIELAHVAAGDRVLDVGGGSGYQAALLAEIGCEVTSIEVVPELAAAMRERLASLGYDRVTVLEGDARKIVSTLDPFDAVIAAAAPASVPEALVECLKPGGRLVLPVGVANQELLVIEKLSDGTIREVNHGFVAFVPMTAGE